MIDHDKGWVTLQVGDRPSGSRVPPVLIGRGASCNVQIDDPRVSEFHASISLRASGLRWIRLRGTLVPDGQVAPVDDQAVEAGTRMWLGGRSGVCVTVLAVTRPSLIPVLRLRQKRGGKVYTLELTPGQGEMWVHWVPQRIPRWVDDPPEEHAFPVWFGPNGWMVRDRRGVKSPVKARPSTFRHLTGPLDADLWVESVSRDALRPTARPKDQPVEFVLDGPEVRLRDLDGSWLHTFAGQEARLLRLLCASWTPGFHPPPVESAKLKVALIGQGGKDSNFNRVFSETSGALTRFGVRMTTQKKSAGRPGTRQLLPPPESRLIRVGPALP